MSLQNVIDGSTWLRQDTRLVYRLTGLIHHVTGASHEPSCCHEALHRQAVEMRLAPGASLSGV